MKITLTLTDVEANVLEAGLQAGTYHANAEGVQPEQVLDLRIVIAKQIGDQVNQRIRERQAIPVDSCNHYHLGTPDTD